MFLEKDWFRPRGYLHFDNRIGHSHRATIEKLVRDPKTVAQHSFYPFLRYDKDKPKITCDEVTKKRFFKMGARPICYASHADAHIYAYYSNVLTKAYESKLKHVGLDDNVIAFRKLVAPDGTAKCNIHLANDAFDKILSYGDCKVFAFDITKFFDTLDAKVLKAQWQSVLGTKGLPDDHYAVFKSVTKFSVVLRDDVFKEFKIPKNPRKQNTLNRICNADEFREIVRNQKMIEVNNVGIPQGSPISATLANIYMLNFDLGISRKAQELNATYYRYCDDILIILPLNSTFDIETFVKSELAKINLSLNDKKTDRSIFYKCADGVRCDRPIQYLGFMFDGQAKYLRTASISFFRRRLKKAINHAVAEKIKYDAATITTSSKRHSIHLKKIFRSHSHIGQRNFISYGRRAQVIMNSKTIRKQLASLDKFLQKEVKWARSI